MFLFTYGIICAFHHLNYYVVFWCEVSAHRGQGERSAQSARDDAHIFSATLRIVLCFKFLHRRTVIIAVTLCDYVTASPRVRDNLRQYWRRPPVSGMTNGDKSRSRDQTAAATIWNNCDECLRTICDSLCRESCSLLKLPLAAVDVFAGILKYNNREWEYHCMPRSGL